MPPDVPEGFTSFPLDFGFVLNAGPYYFGGNDGNTYLFGMRAGPEHENLSKTVHGGALLAFADTAMSATVVANNEHPSVTVSMNAQFISSARLGDWITATTTLVKKTRSLAFVRCELHAEGKVLLTASGVWKLFPSGDPLVDVTGARKITKTD